MRTTGPILAIGGITMATDLLLEQDKEFDWRIPIATAIAVGAFSLAEKAYEPLAVGIAYLALVSTLFVRMNPTTPAPVELLNQWWSSGKIYSQGSVR